MSKPQWTSAYQGETDYHWKGHRLHVRTSAKDYGYNGDYFQTGILPTVGCIYSRSNCLEFPPDDFCVHFPGYARAKWDADFRVVRDFDPPVVWNKWDECWFLPLAIQRACCWDDGMKYAEHGLTEEHLPLIEKCLSDQLKEHFALRKVKAWHGDYCKVIRQRLRKVRGFIEDLTLAND